MSETATEQEQHHAGTLFSFDSSEVSEASEVSEVAEASEVSALLGASDVAEISGVPGESGVPDAERVSEIAEDGEAISCVGVLESAAPGQPAAVRRLSAAVADPVHAYMLIGPRGSGKRSAAAAFSGELLLAADQRAGRRDSGRAERHRRLAAREQHPDIFVLEPEGNQLRRDAEAAALIAEMNRAPVEGDRKAIVVDRFHTATAAAAACLLKPVEEPAESTVWVLLSETVPPQHVTIASRCSRIDFTPLTDNEISALLVSEGLDDEHQAALIAAASGGNLKRARMLASDDQMEARHRAWWSVPSRLDGTGAMVVQLVEELRVLISEAGNALDIRHKQELVEIVEREDALGVRGSYARAAKDRHRRERRQHRTDELLFGLATLTRRYREHITDDEQSEHSMAAIDRLRGTSAALVRNPNEALALQALLLDLPRLADAP